ncbi:hypothetical protein Tco_1362903 [Tanacetum coccineum]
MKMVVVNKKINGFFMVLGTGMETGNGFLILDEEEHLSEGMGRVVGEMVAVKRLKDGCGLEMMVVDCNNMYYTKYGKSPDQSQLLRVLHPKEVRDPFISFCDRTFSPKDYNLDDVLGVLENKGKSFSCSTPACPWIILSVQAESSVASESIAYSTRDVIERQTAHNLHMNCPDWTVEEWSLMTSANE